VAEHFNTLGHTVNLLQLGLPDRFVDQGTHQQQLAECGLDATGIESAIKKRLVQLGLTSPLTPVRNEAAP
jgi:1-deoxy-D-xylulose-5-phosphate synthase